MNLLFDTNILVSISKSPSYELLMKIINPEKQKVKNDLWIASTAALLGLKLITTDADFNHLHQVFLEVQFIDSAALK